MGVELFIVGGATNRTNPCWTRKCIRRSLDLGLEYLYSSHLDMPQ